MLTKMPDAIEILNTLKKMAPEKVLESDGMTVFFFSLFLECGRAECGEYFSRFFGYGKLLPALNHYNLSLIPKVTSPSTVSQFRPISLCNVIYKIISKLMIERLKLVLPKLILPFQLAFVSGHAIQDNYIVATEIFHCMNHMQGRGGWMAIKANMEKAYNRVE